MRLLLLPTFLVVLFHVATGQTVREITYSNQSDTYFYAFITIEGKAFSKKLKVEVDLGDTPEQVNAGKEYSEILTNKKSYAAVLNYMADEQYELVESRDYSFSYQGTGGTYGIIFIMRKMKTNQ
jgi:hypothetical protein